MRGLRATACVGGALALGLLAGGTPEREIYVSVTLEGSPPPPDTVLIQTHDVIPTVVTPGQQAVPAYGLSFVRRSQMCLAPLYLVGLGFRIENLDGEPIDPADVIDRLQVEIGSRKVSATQREESFIRRSEAPREGGREDGEALLEVALEAPVLIPPGDSLQIEVLADISPLTKAPGFAITLAEESVLISHSGCSAPDLLVWAGDTPGAVVSTTTIVSGNLAGSFSNYPNPFAAGREITTFAFFLQRRAEVSLRLYNGFGRLVRTLDAGTSRAGGRVHEDITWDGVDEGGATVQNGTYFAVVTVRYDDGSHDEAIRKVAVLR